MICVNLTEVRHVAQLFHHVSQCFHAQDHVIEPRTSYRGSLFGTLEKCISFRVQFASVQFERCYRTVLATCCLHDTLLLIIVTVVLRKFVTFLDNALDIFDVDNLKIVGGYLSKVLLTTST